MEVMDAKTRAHRCCCGILQHLVSTWNVRMAGALHGGRRARGHRAGTLIVVGHGLHLPDDDALAVLERPLRLGERDLLLQSPNLQTDLVDL